MRLECSDRRLAVKKSPVQTPLPDHDILHAQDGARKPPGQRVFNSKERLPGAVVPRFRIANGQQDLGRWKRRHDFTIELAGGPIDRGSIAAKELPEVDGRIRLRADPEPCVARATHCNAHVITRTQPQELERSLERGCTGATETGADQCQRVVRRSWVQSKTALRLQPRCGHCPTIDGPHQATARRPAGEIHGIGSATGRCRPVRSQT